MPLLRLVELLRRARMECQSLHRHLLATALSVVASVISGEGQVEPMAAPS
jgi:hypothetical protein